MATEKISWSDAMQAIENERRTLIGDKERLRSIVYELLSAIEHGTPEQVAIAAKMARQRAETVPTM